MFKRMLIVATAIVAACATPPQVVEKIVIQKVEVPVAAPCIDELPRLPGWDVDHFINASEFERLKQLIRYHNEVRFGYIPEVQAILEACKRKPHGKN